jgi:hypothetical protein
MSQPMSHSIIRAQVRRAMLEAEARAARQAWNDARTAEERERLLARLEEVARQLRALGPDPRPMMG